MPWSSIWFWCTQDSQAPSPWSPARCWRWLDWCSSIKVGSRLLTISCLCIWSVDSVRCLFCPRRHRRDHQRAAAAQHLSAAVVSYQRDRQSLFGLHQGHPLHHGRQDASVTCHRHGRHSHYWWSGPQWRYNCVLIEYRSDSVACVQMEGVGSIKDDVRRHFRTKLKNIFTKFIRKFG